MSAPFHEIETSDLYKDEVQKQWDNNPCGSHYVKDAAEHTLEWFLEAERYRYDEYAPWMQETMEFARHAGEQVLEIGGGMGTDLCQFARHGAYTTDIDLSAGHLALAQENFQLRGLDGKFVHHDAEKLPFADNTFDLVYSNGVIHHTPNTRTVINDIYRVLKPGGKTIIMVYAENSLHYWRNLVYDLGLKQDLLGTCSIGEIMSRYVEITENNAKPLVKVYTKPRIIKMFNKFNNISILQRQMVSAEVPRALRWLPLPWLGQLMGWNLILKAHKPR
ncbi:MAG: class I SAM-dependent methyltransferase [Xanthomonadales bacterium]|nr:class I SAM-dependent methyltransferase [Xanthomonadales bacterium]